MLHNGLIQAKQQSSVCSRKCLNVVFNVTRLAQDSIFMLTMFVKHMDTVIQYKQKRQLRFKVPVIYQVLNVIRKCSVDSLLFMCGGD